MVAWPVRAPRGSPHPADSNFYSRATWLESRGPSNMTYAVDDQCCVTRDTHSHSENHGLQRPSALLFNRRRHTLRYAMFTTLVSRELSCVRANPSLRFSRDSKKNLWIFFLQIFIKIFYFQDNLCDLGFQENRTTLSRLSDWWFKFEMANCEFPERSLASPTLWNSTIFPR